MAYIKIVNNNFNTQVLGSDLSDYSIYIRRMYLRNGVIHVWTESSADAQIITDITNLLNTHDPDKNITGDNFKLWRFINDVADKKIAPKTVNFKTDLDITFSKDAVVYNHKGVPMSVKYFHLGEEICKRTWVFTYFNIETIQSLLGVDLPTAQAMADDLVWTRIETFHWLKEDGTYSVETKQKVIDYVPFSMAGMPDLMKFYDLRVRERITGRNQIYIELQKEIVPFIMVGLGANMVENARIVGRSFLSLYKDEFDSYIGTGDEEIIDRVINDFSFAFLNYDTSIVGVDCRKWLVNRLRQVPDLETAI